MYFILDFRSLCSSFCRKKTNKNSQFIGKFKVTIAGEQKITPKKLRN